MVVGAGLSARTRRGCSRAQVVVAAAVSVWPQYGPRGGGGGGGLNMARVVAVVRPEWLESSPPADIWPLGFGVKAIMARAEQDPIASSRIQ